jgi:hypothetical protein
MSVFKMSLAAAFAIVGYAAFTSGADASTTSQLNKCRYNTKRQVVECCERILRDENKPYWMVEGGHNCNSAAKCTKKSYGTKETFAIAYVPKKPKLKCFIDMHGGDDNDGGYNPQEPKQPERPQRGNDNNNPGGKD